LRNLTEIYRRYVILASKAKLRKPRSRRQVIYVSVRFRESTARRGAKDKMDKGRRQKGARTTPFTTYEIQFQSTHGPSLSGDKQKLMHFCRITANTPWCHSSLSLSLSLSLSHLDISLPPLCRLSLCSLHILLPFFFRVDWLTGTVVEPRASYSNVQKCRRPIPNKSLPFFLSVLLRKYKLI